MNTSVMIQHIYRDSDYSRLMELTEERHSSYCFRNGFDYVFSVDGAIPRMGQGDWWKVEYLREIITRYEYVIYVDADAVIYDLDFDLNLAPVDRDTIGAVCFPKRYQDDGRKIHYNDHYNVGVLYLRAGGRVNEFMDNWWKSRRTCTHKWQEQFTFNQLAKHIRGAVVNMPPQFNHTPLAHPVDVRSVVKGYHSIRGTDKKRSKMILDLQGIDER